MSCCQWSRGKNDRLIDVETNKPFCGTCWQYWVENKCTMKKKSLIVSNDQFEQLKHKASSDNHVPAQVDNDDNVQPLRAVIHTDGNQYLCSESRRLVFLKELTSDGKLQCVGEMIGSDDLTIKIFNVETVASSSIFPFPTASEDHCETPFAAYEDLAPFLTYLAKLLGKDRKSLRIWDPYYCNGGVKRNFSHLGFISVHNEREDFYAMIRDEKVPEYDCIVTNPPYSTQHMDHIHQLFKFLCNQDRPWFVLQPNYVYVKEYWKDLTASVLKAPRPFFLTPSAPRKYKYKTPAGIRDVQNAQQLKTSPFVSLWYCWTGSRYTAKMYKWIVDERCNDNLTLSLACTEYFLPDAFKDSNDKTRKKKKVNKPRMTSSIKSITSSEKTSRIKKKRKRVPTDSFA